jgi:hypothetical protein
MAKNKTTPAINGTPTPTPAPIPALAADERVCFLTSEDVLLAAAEVFVELVDTDELVPLFDDVWLTIEQTKS